MSIRKDPFEALLDGRKKHEFRRKFYLNNPCQSVFYVSSPVKAICGVGIFDKPIYDTIDNLVKIIKSHSFSSPESLKSYFKDVDYGYALPIKKIKNINPISLAEIREEIPNFRPPQSYCCFDLIKFKPYLRRLSLYETPNETIQRTFF